MNNIVPIIPDPDTTRRNFGAAAPKTEQIERSPASPKLTSALQSGLIQIWPLITATSNKIRRVILHLDA